MYTSLLFRFCLTVLVNIGREGLVMRQDEGPCLDGVSSQDIDTLLVYVVNGTY